MDSIRFAPYRESLHTYPSSKMSQAIGTFTLDEDTTFRNQSFECAAWWREILVEAGTYEIVTNGYWVFIRLPGIVTDGYFPSMYGGVAIGGKTTDSMIGQETTHSLMPYLYEVAKRFADPDQPAYEAYPQVEVVCHGFGYGDMPSFGIVIHEG